MKDLPVLSHHERIVETIRKNRVTVIVGETGSGKTTQIPAMLLEALSPIDRIAVTEPRRFAATSVANFVSDELFGEEVGGTCGYKVRNDNACSDSTKIVYMTEGILLQMLKRDPMLSEYQIIMVDEVHERSANVDLILGVLKDLLNKRLELKVVVASATVDSEMFSEYFGNCPIVNIPGRVYPVDVIYHDLGFQPISKLADFLIKTVVPESVGDILVFFSGVDEISEVREEIESKNVSGIVVLELHGSQTPEDQRLVYKDYPGRQKLILATNIAETSVTIDGVTSVVDTGSIKQSDIDPWTHTSTLRVVSHSRSGCKQRTGRAGRTAPGVCYRVFSEQDFESRPAFTKPEIQRMGLESFVLLMLSLDLPVHTFDFITKPEVGQVDRAIKVLQRIGAIDNREKVTSLGYEMLRLPLDVELAKFVLESRSHGCVRQAVICSAFLSVQSVLISPKDKRDEARLAHAKFGNNSERGMSDLVRFLRVWDGYSQAENRFEWCRENFVHTKRMREIHEIISQLIDTLDSMDVELTSSDDKSLVNKVFAICFSESLAHSYNTSLTQGAYSGVLRRDLHYKAHPGSVMSFGSAQYVVATQIVQTTNVWARVCVPVEKAWLPLIAPNLFTKINPCLIGRGEKAGEYVILSSLMKNGVVVEEIREVCGEEEAISVQAVWEDTDGSIVAEVYKDDVFSVITDAGINVSFYSLLNFQYVSGNSFIFVPEGGKMVPKCLFLFNERTSAKNRSKGKQITPDDLLRLKNRFAR